MYIASHRVRGHAHPLHPLRRALASNMRVILVYVLVTTAIAYTCEKKNVLKKSKVENWVAMKGLWELGDCTTLDLTRFPLGKSKASRSTLLAELVTAMIPSKVERLWLKSCSLSDEDVDELSRLVAARGKLFKLDLSQNELSSQPSGLPTLLKNLAGSTLRGLDLSANQITSTFGLVEALASSQIEQLDLSANQVSDHTGVAYALAKDVPLKELIMKQSHFQDDDGERLAKALKSNTHLKKLHISSGLGDRGARAIFEALLHATNLVEIDLRQNMLTDASGLPLIAALLHRPPKHIRVKSFDGAHWDERMVDAINEAMASGLEMEKLELNWAVPRERCTACADLWSICSPPCSLADDQSLAHLAAALEGGARLHTLDLSHQPLGKAGLRALGHALEKSQLHTLRLDHCDFEEGAVNELADYLAQGPPSLRVLSLENATIHLHRPRGWDGQTSRKLNNDEGSALARALTTNRHLERLVLKDNGVSSFNFAALDASSDLKALDLRKNGELASITQWIKRLRCDEPPLQVEVLLDEDNVHLAHKDRKEVRRLLRLGELERAQAQKQCADETFKARMWMCCFVCSAWLVIILSAALWLGRVRNLTAARVDSDLAEAEQRVDDSLVVKHATEAMGAQEAPADFLTVYHESKYNDVREKKELNLVMPDIKNMPPLRRNVIMARVVHVLELAIKRDEGVNLSNERMDRLLEQVKEANEKTEKEYQINLMVQRLENFLNMWLNRWFSLQEAGPARLKSDERARQVAKERKERHDVPKMGLQDASLSVRAVCQPAVNAVYFVWLGGWRLLALGFGLYVGASIVKDPSLYREPNANASSASLSSWTQWVHSGLLVVTQSTFEIVCTLLLGPSQADFFELLMLPLACVVSLILSAALIVAFELSMMPVPRFIRARYEFVQVCSWAACSMSYSHLLPLTLLCLSRMGAGGDDNLRNAQFYHRTPRELSVCPSAADQAGSLRHLAALPTGVPLFY